MSSVGSVDDVPPADLTCGEHFSCVLSAVLLARVRELGGGEAVAEVLERAGIDRGPAELTDLTNWISYAEAEALWEAGARVTHHPTFPRAVGADSARRLAASPVAAMLRSLGSPERVYHEVGTTARKYSAVTEMRAIACEPGHAHLEARPRAGFPRSAAHCEWTIGLIGCLTELFGLPAAEVEHVSCASLGAPACHYHVRWPIWGAESSTPKELTALRGQIDAMNERLTSIFDTAADLIGPESIDEVLVKIAGRAALEVRAPRHLLAVRLGPDAEQHVHQEGFGAERVSTIVGELFAGERRTLVSRPGWLVVPVRSTRHEYGILLAAYAQDEGAFLDQERELFEVYARYAASALDSAGALEEAKAQAAQSGALLGLARSLSVAGSVQEVASRLCETVPTVIDCDAVAVYLNEGDTLVQTVMTDEWITPSGERLPTRWESSTGSTLQALLREPCAEPIFFDVNTTSAPRARALRELGLSAVALVPLVSGEQLLGMLIVCDQHRSDRLRSRSSLRDRLSGVGAQAATALENARLMDLVTHRATHDDLTGLANRAQFSAALNAAATGQAPDAAAVAVFYVDLDAFKPINDEFGHDVGDELLAAVAQRLRDNVRSGDLVARLGGDEFAVLAEINGAGDAEFVAARIAESFRLPFDVAGHAVSMTAAVGTSLPGRDGFDPGEALRHADRQMLAAKRSRPNGSRDVLA